MEVAKVHRFTRGSSGGRRGTDDGLRIMCKSAAGLALF